MAILTRAREAGDAKLLADLLMVDVVGLRHFAKACTRAKNRLLWRQYSARRTSMVAVALGRLERLLGKRFAGRRKTGEGWIVMARQDNAEASDVLRVSTPPANRLRDFVEQHVAVVLLRSDLLSPEELASALKVK
jgi:hypothetical protein